MNSKFESIIDKYKLEVLEEQPTPSNPGQAAPPAPEVGGVPEEPQEPQGPTPEEIVNELEKSSKKPWIDLAGILGRAMEYKWTDEDLNRINSSLPGGLAVRDFINVRTSPHIKDKYDSNIVSAAITLFDQVDSLMNRDDLEVVPAEER